MVWEEGNNEVFYVQFLYQALEQCGDSSFPFKAIWIPWAPPKVSIFAWEATWGKILIVV